MDPKGPRPLPILVALFLLVPQSAPFAQVRVRSAPPVGPGAFAVGAAAPAASGVFDGLRGPAPAPHALASAPALPPGVALSAPRLAGYPEAASEAASRGAADEAQQWQRLEGLQAAWRQGGSDREAAGLAAARVAGLLRRGVYKEVVMGVEAARDPEASARRRQADALALLGAAAGTDADLRVWLKRHLEPAIRGEAARVSARAALPDLRTLLGHAVTLEDDAAITEAAEANRQADALLARRDPARASAQASLAQAPVPPVSEDSLLAEIARSESLTESVESGRLTLELLRGMPERREAAGAAADKLSRDLEALREARDRLALLGKLGQRGDLGSPGASAEADAVEELARRYEGVLSAGGSDALLVEAGETRGAGAEAVRRRLSELLSGERKPVTHSDAPLAGTPLERGLEERLGRIADLEARAQGELASRDSSAQLLALADRLRGGALRERRMGREQLEFRKNHARLAMVMDLSYSLNVITAAEKAIIGMQALLDEKLASVAGRRQASKEAAEAARRAAGRKAEWDQAVKDKVAADEANVGLFTRLGEQSGQLTDRLGRYRVEVKGLLSLIDARDRGRSAGALAEYQRRLALLPALVEWRTHGAADSGSSISKVSLDHLRSEARRAEDYLAKVREGLDKIDQVPLEFAGVLVVAVPGVPSVMVANPGAERTLQILEERKDYWRAQRVDFAAILSNVTELLDPGNLRRETDDFGDSVLQSAAARRAEEASKLASARSDAARAARELDETARLLSEAGGAGLASLSGRNAEDLRQALPGYAESLMTLSFPDTDEGTKAKIEKISAARVLPVLADAVAREAEATATLKALDDALARVLPLARERFAAAVRGVDDILADVAADEAFVHAGFPGAQGQALIDRKRRLLTGSLKPMLEGLKDLIDGTLIPFQRDSIRSVDPSASGDGYATLYKEKQKLLERISDSYEKTMPWSLASNGAPEGDAAAARAGIAAQRSKFQEYSQKVVDFLSEIRRRKDLADAGVEDVYGESMPFSLPKRIAQMRAENVRRAGEVNRLSGEVNAILVELDAATGGRHALAASYRLPTDIAPNSPASAARLHSLADSRIVQNLASKLKAVGDEEMARGSGGGLGVGGGDGGIPEGTQPSPQLAASQRAAVLALDAVKRLVPSSLTAGGASLTEAMARYLFTDGVAEASRVSLEEQIPLFEAFLTRAESVLAAAFADLDADAAFVSGRLEDASSFYERKVRVYDRVRRIAEEGAILFRQKVGWSKESFATVASVAGYYDTLSEIYTRSDEALDAEARAAQEYKDTLKKTADELAAQREQVGAWLRQLNDPHESAMRRVGDSLSRLQDRTRAVLETNIKAHEARRRYDGAAEVLQGTLESIERERGALSEALRGVDLGDLSDATARRIEALGLGGSSWLSAGPRGRGAVVVRKSDFAGFLAQLFGAFEADSSARDIVRLREELLKNPLALSQLLPNARMLELGDNGDGFYLVYNSEFSTPHGLETSSQVTLGNVLRLGDSNVSVTGHRFASPPSAGNAPYGDQGVTVSVETLGGENYVNYLDVTLHRFIQDIPTELTPVAQAHESRMMVFDDFALMLNGDKLYFGAAGFADFALTDGKDKPYTMGGNLKTSIKFTEIMHLDASHTELFARDPRRFLQTVNLDFTKFDPSLDRDFIIDAHGDDRHFRRDRVGVGIDIGRAMEQADSFTVDFFVERVRGTDDLPNDALGATIVKGISFEVGGVPVRTELSGTGSVGTEYNSVSGRASFELPNQGIVLSASGKNLGDATSYLLELRKRFGDNTEATLSYGSPYLGMVNRLAIGVNTSFTLGQLWRAVAGRAGEDLLGGKALEEFNKDLEAFFRRDNTDNPLIAELARVFDADVGKRLISLEMGRLARELATLRSAGAFLDNTRMRGMVGFVSNPVGTDIADRAAGGGFQVGTETEMTLSKTQRALLDSKVAALYSAGLSLQVRLLELTKLWQETVAELLEARWEGELGLFMAANAPDDVLAKDGSAKAAEAAARFHQARLRYNMLTGRSPEAAVLFAEANPQDLDYLFLTLGKVLAEPGRLGALLARLGPSALPSQEPGFNLLDWVPWVEKVTFWVGVQLQDLLANQVLGGGINIRLPIYDPYSPRRDKAYVMESRAVALEMLASYRELRLRAEHERLQTASYDAQIGSLATEGPIAAKAVADAIRAYRNRLMGQDELWAVFRRWHWTVSRLVDARARASLAAAWAVLDQAVANSGPEDRRAPSAPAGPVAGLDSAIDLAASRSATLESLASRSQAAAELLEAAGRRIEKVSADVNIGLNVTAAGVAWIPALGLTGMGLTPIISIRFKPEELRALESDRRAGEGALYDHMRGALEADLTGQLYASYAALNAACEARAVLETELLPAARRRAETGGPEARRALLELEMRDEALKGEEAQLRATLNHLMGRAPGTEVDWGQDPEQALASLKARAEGLGASAARRGVLAERVRVARDVETIVDKNLRVQDLRLEPVSLIGRSLGRLVAALTGSGDSSPELVALARQQVLEAEADQRAFERAVVSQRARLGYEVSKTRRRLNELGHRTDPEARFEAALMRGRLRQAEAELALLGGKETSGELPPAPPGAWAELEERLAAALRAETPVPGLGGGAGFVPDVSRWSAEGMLRYYDARQSIGKDPIGKRFMEGWIEVRLGSRTTPPEALLALAALQEDRAARLFEAAQGRAESKALSLLARLRLDAGLLRWARAGTDERRVALAERLTESLSKGLAEASAHLGLGEPLTVEAFLAFVPLSEAESPAEAAEAFRTRVDSIGLEALRRTLFTEGLPAGLEGARDSLSQIKADLVASRMSFKGFTPVGAFGMFRGRWVAGGFLEAPDPQAVRDTLEGILADALRQELESQDRLKELSLRLQGLMAAVADGARLLEARGDRLRAAEGNLSGALVRLERGMATPDEAAAARAEAGAALEAFLDSMVTLRSDFVRLVAELKALGQAGSTGIGPTRRNRPAETRGTALAELSRWTAGRMADAGFAARLDSLFDGRGLVSSEDRNELRELGGWYRKMLEDSEAVRHHPDFDPAQRLDLLIKADPEGRRILIERLLGRLLAGVETGSEPGWEGLRAFLRGELEKDCADAGADSRARRELARDLRRSAAGQLAPALQETAEGLILRRQRVEEAREALLTSYLSSDQTPESFLLKDTLLDEYLKALTTYDETVISSFSSEALRTDPSAAWSLNAMFSLKESAARRAALLRHGRGLLAVDALLAVENSRLEVLRRERAGPEAVSIVSQRVAELEATRRRWLERPEQIESVTAVLNGNGAVERWVTRGDIEGLERSGRITEMGGERWLLPAERAGAKPASAAEAAAWGGRRLLGGADAAADAAGAARRAATAERAAVETAAVLERSEFVLVGANGRPADALDLADVRRLEAEGRVLYFAAKPDRDGRRRALHPLEARQRPVDEVVALVQRTGAVLPAGRFESLEAALRAPEGAKLERLEAGARGLNALAGEAEVAATASARLGWITLKLESFAFVLEAGRPVAVFMSLEELTKAQADFAKLDPKDPRRASWTFHRSADLVWELAEDGVLAAVRVPSGPRVSFSGDASRRVAGPVVAVELDAKGRLVKVFQDEAAFKAAAATWWIEDLEGKIWRQEKGKIAPLHRLKRYIDPETRLPVRLGRDLLQRRLDEAADELGDVGRWAVMPWNWPNIVLEIPRGIIQAPIELITGRDPNQHSYLGRTYMYRRDGGATVRRGPLGQIIHFIDIFDILPDPVDRFMDPSQFPREVYNDSPLLPGEWEHEKDPRTDTSDIHFGAGSLIRFARWAREDLEEARGRALGSFDGGVRSVFLETVRGRDGLYDQERLEYRTGADAVTAALREAGAAVGIGGEGRMEAAPDHVEVERVAAELSVSLGQRQLAERAHGLREAAARLFAASRTDRAAELSAEADRLEADLQSERAKLEEARRALSAVKPPLADVLMRSAFPVMTLAPMLR